MGAPKFLIKLNRFNDFLQKELDEATKWLVVLSMYVFYYMLRKVFYSFQIDFLVYPLIWLGFWIFTARWFFPHLVCFVEGLYRQKSIGQKCQKCMSWIVAICFDTSLIFLLLFLIYQHNFIISLGLLFLLLTAFVPIFCDPALKSGHTWPFRIFVLLSLSMLVWGVLESYCPSEVLNNQVIIALFMFFAAYLWLVLFTKKNRELEEKELPEE